MGVVGWRGGEIVSWSMVAVVVAAVMVVVVVVVTRGASSADSQHPLRYLSVLDTRGDKGGADRHWGCSQQPQQTVRRLIENSSLTEARSFSLRAQLQSRRYPASLRVG